MKQHLWWWHCCCFTVLRHLHRCHGHCCHAKSENAAKKDTLGATRDVSPCHTLPPVEFTLLIRYAENMEYYNPRLCPLSTFQIDPLLHHSYSDPFWPFWPQAPVHPNLFTQIFRSWSSDHPFHWTLYSRSWTLRCHSHKAWERTPSVIRRLHKT